MTEQTLVCCICAQQLRQRCLDSLQCTQACAPVHDQTGNGAVTLHERLCGPLLETRENTARADFVIVVFKHAHKLARHG